MALPCSFFFDGQKVKDDYGLAKDIGEYWARVIMRGHGSFNSPNMNKRKYKRLGVAMIDYRDETKITCLKDDVAKYLVKVDLNCSETLGKRTYRQGLYRPRNRLLGRPRMYPSKPLG